MATKEKFWEEFGLKTAEKPTGAQKGGRNPLHQQSGIANPNNNTQTMIRKAVDNGDNKHVFFSGNYDTSMLNITLPEQSPRQGPQHY
ncbi:hypothetical protein VTI74DRAFT_11333 [Chaetomium olivicolor]